MKRALITLAALGIGIGSIAATDVAGTKAIFTANKCSTCHSISSQGVTKSMAASKAPDLSSVGKKANAAQITAFLKKTGQIGGKNHPMAWKGSDADLQTVATWLAGLKK